jgi:hypothetical protein
VKRLQEVIIQTGVVEWYVRDVVVVFRVTYRIVKSRHIRLELIEARVLIDQVIFGEIDFGLVEVSHTGHVERVVPMGMLAADLLAGLVG